MIFNPTIINHTTPQVTVIVPDSSGGTGTPVSYNEIKNSLGTQVYNIESFYISSNNINQINGTIQYNRYDATGTQTFRSIVTTVDPFQYQKSLIVDLKDGDAYFILNGNSSLQANILPNTEVTIQLYTRRLTNQFGRNLNIFRLMEELFKKPDFFQRYGDIEQIKEINLAVEESIPEHVSVEYELDKINEEYEQNILNYDTNEDTLQFSGKKFVGKTEFDINLDFQKLTYTFVFAAAITIGTIYLYKNDYLK